MPTPYSKILHVNGADASKFLQGQLSCDVLALQDQATCFGAYCSIKGKVDCFFRLMRVGDDYQLLMPTEIIEQTLTELKKYAVFSKVNLKIIDFDATIDEEQEVLRKIPEVYLATSGLFFPHDLNLPELGAVSFSKGCYRGQEIVARMQHRGNLKRHLQGFTSPSRSINVADTIINSEQQAAGTIVRVFKQAGFNTIGLAVVTDSSLNDQLMIADAEINLV